jgi:hypothetical protein
VLIDHEGKYEKDRPREKMGKGQIGKGREGQRKKSEMTNHLGKATMGYALQTGQNNITRVWRRIWRTERYRY